VGGPGGKKGELAGTNQQRLETQNDVHKMHQIHTIMGFKQHYLVRPLLVEIQGTKTATCEKF
jgi:hypothetical protein